ncbi:MAG TPA: beta-ketoacyl-ACP reductase [Anaerolineaceae bacterium]|nr:beta-ketoacyl-ACP reductase [Anaerolineaceae bacterium]
MRLKDKVCIITGGAAGIGKATAEKFYAEGAKVIICDLNQAAGDALVAQLGENAKYYQVNVTDRQAVQAFVDQVVEEFGRVDVLINNAGITKDGQFVKFKEGEKVGEMSEEAFDAVVAVNLKGVFNCTQAVTPYMIKQGGGAITSASSVVGLYGNFGQTNYAATKFGVIGMTKTWARELGKYQIRVNAVAPGFILTEMVLKMPEHVLANMAANAPLKRLGKPEEIANVYCWLSSDEASYIHGAVISADGGIVLGT